MARLIYTDFSTFNMGGTAYIADLRQFTEDPGPVYADGGGFASGFDKEVLVKLGHVLPFEVQMSNLGADSTAGSDDDDDLEMTNLCVSAFSLGGTNHLANLRSFTFTIERVTREGSGAADLRQYPISVKRRYTGNASILVDTTTEIPFVQNISDQGAPSDIYGSGSAFYLPMVFTITDPTGTPTVVFSYNGDVNIKPRHVVNYEDIQVVDIDWTNRGNPSAHTGVGILATIMGSAQPLIDLVWKVGELATDTNTLTAGAFIRRLSLNVQDAAIISMNGEMQVVTEPTFS